MENFRIETLIDITRTGVFKGWEDSLGKRQQDNFQTLHQTLEIRGNVYFNDYPTTIVKDWSMYGYGKKERTWVWKIYTEQNDIFLIDENPIAAMMIDINYVPFNNNCTETAKFKTCLFSTEIKPVNILFTIE
jgi:hypothetical protein